MATLQPMLDCRWLGVHDGTGRVTQHVLAGLDGLAASGSRDDSLVLWGPPDELAAHRDRHTVAGSVGSPGQWRGQRQLMSIPEHEGAIYLHQVRPLRDWRSATLIHDTIALRHGRRALLPARRAFMRLVAVRSAHLLTVSNHSAAAIVDDLGVDPAKITRLHLPIDRRLAARVRDRRREIPGPPRDVLYVGRVATYKNIDRLLEAIATSGTGVGRRVHLFGPHPDDHQALYASASAVGLDDVVVAADRSDEALVDAYARAAVVATASLEEGWGLPLYEAVACGIPVVASNRGALPEVANHAVSPFVVADPERGDELAEALAATVGDRDPADMDDASHRAVAASPDDRQLATQVLATLDRLR